MRGVLVAAGSGVLAFFGAVWATSAAAAVRMIVSLRSIVCSQKRDCTLRYYSRGIASRCAGRARSIGDTESMARTLTQSNRGGPPPIVPVLPSGDGGGEDRDRPLPGSSRQTSITGIIVL